jgi:23S rRNA (cytidine1920-2'-O)/16S rRNA (cytidine1409-2'-O)-methyltransferase
MKRTRLDHLLVERGLAPDLKRAAAYIMAGHVRVGEGRVRRPSEAVPPDAAVDLLLRQYVSRAGHKLAGALDALGVDVEGLVVLDAGSSTGGFVDCLLQRGAARVHAVDVGAGLIDWRLRQDPRVVLHERTHAGRLELDQIGERVDLVTADLSFISLTRVLPALARVTRAGGELVVMVKPQFEAARHEVPEGGVITDPALRDAIVDRVAAAAAEIGLAARGRVASSLPGSEGNVEFFLRLAVSEGA